jgi:hypothetical protein
MNERQDIITKMLHRTHEAYRRGEYMALFGSDYESYFSSVSREKFVDHFFGRRKYRGPLQVAFASNDPRSDEIVLWILEYSGVVTNQRLFFVNDDQLAHPPIELNDVEAYDLRGFSKLRAIVQLRNGSKIKCKVDTGPDPKLFMQAVNAARDPASKEKLTAAPPTRGASRAEDLRETAEQKAALDYLDALSRQLAEEEIAEYGIAVLQNLDFDSKTDTHGLQKNLSLWAGRALFGIAADLAFGGDDGHETKSASKRPLAMIGISPQGNVYGALIGLGGASADASKLMRCKLKPGTNFKSHISLLKAVQTSEGLTGITLQTDKGKTIEVDFPKCIVPDNYRWPIRIRRFRDSVKKQT